MGSQYLTSTTMKLVILSLCLALACALPTSQKDSQTWRPAAGKDLSKYKLKTPAISFAPKTESTSAKKPLEFKKGWKSFDDICGLENPGMDKIVGGHEAAENEWPWQVALFIDDAWFCGGSIISDEYVMTAAHCADGASYFNILAGAHDVRADSEPHRVEITSYEGFTHPNWDPNTLENDIALSACPRRFSSMTTSALPVFHLQKTSPMVMLEISPLQLAGVRMLTVLEESHLNCRWLKISLSSTILPAIVFTA